MKTFLLFFVVIFIFIQTGDCQIIPIESCIVWQKSICNTSHINISPDSKYIATSCDDGFIRIYHIENGDLFKELNVNSGILYTVKYSSDGKYIISVGFDGMIRVWDIITWKEIKSIQAGYPDGAWYYATISHNNKYIASTRQFEGVSLWDFNTGELIKNYPPLPPTELNGGPLGWSVEFSPDDKYIAVAIDFNPGRLINIENDSSIIIDNSKYAYRTFYATISDNGSKFITGYESKDRSKGGINIYEVSTRKYLKTIEIGRRIIDINVSPDNKYIVIGSGTENYIIWDINTGLHIENWLRTIKYSKFSQDSNFLVFYGVGGLTLINLKKITGIKENVGDKDKNNEIINIYPNPSDSIILIEINIKEPQKIKLTVENINGDEIKILSNIYLELGVHQINWNSKEVANGEFFIKLVSGNSVDVKKVIINK